LACLLYIFFILIFYSYKTKNFLFRSLCQGGQKLPEGPLLLNPGSAIEAFRQVGYLRNCRVTNQTNFALFSDKKSLALAELGGALQGLHFKRPTLFAVVLFGSALFSLSPSLSRLYLLHRKKKDQKRDKVRYCDSGGERVKRRLEAKKTRAGKHGPLLICSLYTAFCFPQT
jgi:hypothetical protein